MSAQTPSQGLGRLVRKVFFLGLIAQGVLLLSVLIAALREVMLSQSRTEKFQARQTQASRVIARRGGREAVAHIVDVRSVAGDYCVIYQFEAVMPDGKWRTVTGRIETDWLYADVADSYQHGKALAWKEKYKRGFTFVVRYLPSDPQVHTLLEAFDFAA